MKSVIVVARTGSQSKASTMQSLIEKYDLVVITENMSQSQVELKK